MSNQQIIIAIIEQDFQYASWMANIFHDMGFTVRTVMDVATASAMLESQKPTLMIVDYLLPPAGGVAFINTFRRNNPQAIIPCLYTLPVENISPLLRDQLHFLDSFITKPSSIPELVERVNTLLLDFNELPSIIQQLGKHTTHYRGSGYTRADISVLFGDVRGFTAFSENHDPETSAGILNSIFEIMAEAVLRYGGIIDKYIGDEMMAIFGYGTQDNSGHDLAAIYAAQDMIDGVTQELNNNLLAQDGNLAIGVGVHCGYALVGPIGATFRRDVTAIGDTVNTASRLCSQAKKGEVIISSEMFKRNIQIIEVVDQRQVSLKGKREMQFIYSVKLKKAPTTGEFPTTGSQS